MQRLRTQQELPCMDTDINNLIPHNLDKQLFADINSLLDQYWYYHPRFRFLKTLPRNAKLLDIGANTGGLAYWRKKASPDRGDIEMYAVDLKEGVNFRNYKDFQLCNIETSKLKYPDEYFDGIVMSHVIEHLKNPDFALSEISRTLKTQGRIYLECPTPETLTYANRSEFRKIGHDVSTMNFFDDPTHIKTYTLHNLAKLGVPHGLKILESGIIENKFLEPELLYSGARMKDTRLLTYGLWSKLRWAQYMIAEKTIIRYERLTSPVILNIYSSVSRIIKKISRLIWHK
jgi:SAM-dependent methyltransferase